MAQGAIEGLALAHWHCCHLARSHHHPVPEHQALHPLAPSSGALECPQRPLRNPPRDTLPKVRQSEDSSFPHPLCPAQVPRRLQEVAPIFLCHCFPLSQFQGELGDMCVGRGQGDEMSMQLPLEPPTFFLRVPLTLLRRKRQLPGVQRQL